MTGINEWEEAGPEKGCLSKDKFNDIRKDQKKNN